VELARAVGGEDDRRAPGRLDGADLGDRDLEVRQHLEQEGLELVVGAIDLVDEQHHGLLGGDRLQQRPADEEGRPEQLLLVDGALLRGADVQQLAGVVPLVDGVRDVEPLVALQADHAGARGARQRLGQLGLPDPRLALQQQRLLDRQRQEDGRREPPLGQIGLFEERVLQLADGLEAHAARHPITLANIGRSVSNDNRWTCPGRVMYKSHRPWFAVGERGRYGGR
jgi:hypothetical protein